MTPNASLTDYKLCPPPDFLLFEKVQSSGKKGGARATQVRSLGPPTLPCEPINPFSLYPLLLIS